MVDDAAKPTSMVIERMRRRERERVGVAAQPAVDSSLANNQPDEICYSAPSCLSYIVLSARQSAAALQCAAALLKAGPGGCVDLIGMGVSGSFSDSQSKSTFPRSFPELRYCCHPPHAWVAPKQNAHVYERGLCYTQDHCSSPAAFHRCSHRSLTHDSSRIRIALNAFSTVAVVAVLTHVLVRQQLFLLNYDGSIVLFIQSLVVGGGAALCLFRFFLFFCICLAQLALDSLLAISPFIQYDNILPSGVPGLVLILVGVERYSQQFARRTLQDDSKQHSHPLIWILLHTFHPVTPRPRGPHAGLAILFARSSVETSWGGTNNKRAEPRPRVVL